MVAWDPLWGVKLLPNQNAMGRSWFWGWPLQRIITREDSENGFDGQNKLAQMYGWDPGPLRSPTWVIIYTFSVLPFPPTFSLSLPSKWKIKKFSLYTLIIPKILIFFTLPSPPPLLLPLCFTFHFTDLLFLIHFLLPLLFFSQPTNFFPSSSRSCL